MAQVSALPGVASARSRVLFVNENLGGHATMHLALRRSLEAHPEVEAEFLDVPEPRLVRRIVGASVPGLGRLDLDLQALRYQLAQSVHLRSLLQHRLDDIDVLHAYSQHAVLMSDGVLRHRPSVVSTDCTTSLNAHRLPYRAPTRFTAPASQIAQRLERRVFKSATLVVAQSEWAAESLRTTCGVSDDRLRVIPFGILPFELSPRHHPSGPPQVTFVGASMSRKGGWRLLRAFRKHLRDTCVLNIVTRDRVAPERGVRVLNDFVPGDPRLPGLLADTAVFAFPSEIDTFGYAPLEAMAAAVPVVATRCNAVPEIVEEGVTGLLVEPDDDALAGAVSALVADEARAEAMGAAGRRRMLDRFDARVTTAQLLVTLEEARRRFAG
jgi:alpha-maltose-1-phosphate synthase